MDVLDEQVFQGDPADLGGPVLVTGCAGFIGHHLCHRLLSQGYQVAGLDIVNDYYDVSLKEDRLKRLEGEDGYQFFKIDMADRSAMETMFEQVKPAVVINLAAQAGVRYSLTNPHSYVQSNMVGFLNILEGCRHHSVKHLLYASSSSVYGWNTTMPFSEHHGVNHPISLYAASKKSNEMMAHAYAALFNVPCTGLRFFTVYGDWGRPDMALFIFTKKILAGEPIDVYNNGQMGRDFTYVGDVVEGVQRLMHHIPTANADWDSANPDPASGACPFRIYNVGNNSPVSLMDMIGTLEKQLGIVAEKNFMPMQPGDVAHTWADASELMNAVGYKPSTSLDVGIGKFVDWYRAYYNL